MQALRALVAEQPDDLKPRYPAWFRVPDKPSTNQIWQTGQRLHEDHVGLRQYMDLTLRRLRPGEMSGAFPEDLEARRSGDQEVFTSTALIDEHHHVAGLLADLEFTVQKPYFDERKKQFAHQLEDAIWHLRREEILRHSDANNKWLPLDEANTFLTYGMLVNRTVIDLSDPEFPFDSELIDPATVYARGEGKRGLRAVYRVYESRIDELLDAYGDAPDRVTRALRDQYGGGVDYDATTIQVVEYWDRWWWGVFAGDALAIKPLEAHEYGLVPFTIQYSPLGEPMFTEGPRDTPLYDRSADLVVFGANRKEDELIHKLVPYIGPMAPRHDQFEAVMARVLTGLKLHINPPLIREVDAMLAGKERPEVQVAPGAVNEVQRGLESLQGFPFAPAPFEVDALLTAINGDWLRGSLSPTAMGANDRSNVSGAAQHAMADAAAAKIVKWEKSLQLYHTRRFSSWLMLWRNHGHLARYAGDEPTPLVFPYRSRSKDGPVAFELTREAIDAVGPRVDIVLKRQRRDQWLPLLNAAKIANEMGVLPLEYIAENLLGLDGFERLHEEWQEEFALMQAIRHPLFAQVFTVPAGIMAELREAEGDPEKQAVLQQMLQLWNQVVLTQVGPAGGAPPTGAGGPPAPNPNPNTTHGVSFTELGQGPGSLTGQPGGPIGPRQAPPAAE